MSTTMNKTSKAGIIEFAEKLFFLETGKPIRFESWQKEKILRPIFYNLDENSRRKTNLALIGMPKKNGKSSLASVVAAYGLLADGEASPEIYSVAGDKEQAKIIFDQTRKAFERSPILSREVKILRDAIERKDGNGFYKVLSADAPSAHGFNPHFVIFDELWNQTNYDLWEALTHSPARKQPLHFIVTYAGYDQYKGNLLWDLYQTGLKGDDSRMFMYWTNENQASWINPEYLAQQKKRLPEHIYLRLHENMWTSGISSFLTREDIDNVIDGKLSQKFMGGEGKYFFAVDLGLAKDRTVITVCHKDPYTQKVMVDHIKTFQGSPKEKLKISDVEDYLLYLKTCFKRIEKVLVDPWQMQNSIQRLNRELPIEEFTFTSANITRLTQNLFSLFKDQKISLFDYQPLLRELATVKIVEKAYGFRIDHESGQHDDHVISLGMAALYCNQTEAASTGKIMADGKSISMKAHDDCVFSDKPLSPWDDSYSDPD